jgi:hypothetical protein
VEIMRVRALMALIVIAALVGHTSGAPAQRVTAKFADNHNDIIGFVTGETKKANGKDKDAIMVISDGEADDPLAVEFPDAAAWEKFANLWIKAVAAAPPAKERDGLAIGNYQDSSGMFLTLTKYNNGEVTVALVGRDFDTRVFHVEPQAFEMFGSKILEVSKILAD